MDSAFPSLEIFSISECDGQHSLLEGGLPLSLKQIDVESGNNLTTFGQKAFQRLTSLKKSEISKCDSLQCLSRRLPTSLCGLTIRYCDLLTGRLQRETREDWPIVALSTQAGTTLLVINDVYITSFINYCLLSSFWVYVCHISSINQNIVFMHASFQLNKPE
ncbi:LRR domain containing protein [Parasponia andersonii]|uniref:LRR domain containing protein n=1 Tax=Parasponia andersonii TaxID=3476 RepID=A0A2P5DLV4_PARAD|nr:LRR domain containing protein [Parasponia andersonii]